MGLNNKGQSLVMFVLIIPIILLILVFVYDVAGALYEKNRLSNTSYLACEYALDNIGSIDENDVISYILKNSDDLNNISVIIKDNIVDIELDKNIKGIFGKSFNFDLIEIRSKYEGTIIGGKKNIERIK